MTTKDVERAAPVGRVEPSAAAMIAEAPGITEAVRALVIAVDEVDDAERELEQRVRAVFGVNNTDFAVLQYIDRVRRRGRTARVGEISNRFGVSSGSATEIVHRLVQADLVERSVDPSDARVRTLDLTPDAAERLQQVVGAVRADLDDLLLTITEDEEERLIELLGHVRDIFRGMGGAIR